MLCTQSIEVQCQSLTSATIKLPDTWLYTRVQFYGVRSSGFFLPDIHYTSLFTIFWRCRNDQDKVFLQALSATVLALHKKSFVLLNQYFFVQLLRPLNQFYITSVDDASLDVTQEGITLRLNLYSVFFYFKYVFNCLYVFLFYVSSHLQVKITTFFGFIVLRKKI